MRKAPYTHCKLYMDHADGLAAGDYIVTAAGSAYLVQTVRVNRNKPYRRHMDCLRWPIDEIPEDARCYRINWYRR